MQATLWATIISAFSFMITAMVGLFIMGTRWAKVGARVASIDERLLKIERLFRMSLIELRTDHDKNDV